MVLLPSGKASCLIVSCTSTVVVLVPRINSPVSSCSIAVTVSNTKQQHLDLGCLGFFFFLHPTAKRINDLFPPRINLTGWKQQEAQMLVGAAPPRANPVDHGELSKDQLVTVTQETSLRWAMGDSCCQCSTGSGKCQGPLFLHTHTHTHSCTQHKTEL